MAALPILQVTVLHPLSDASNHRLAWRALLLLGAVIAATLAPPANAAPTITKFPNSQNVAVGTNIALSVEATGTAPLTYQWFRGANAITGATAATYAITNAQLADAGQYSVAVTDATGTIRTFTPYGPAFAAGVAHSLFTKIDGTLWAVGSNSSGQLGDGTLITRFIPANVASGVTAVSAGGSHSLFVKSDGSLWAMGANNYGQLGDGSTTNRNLPVQIVAAGVTTVAAGTSHSLFLKTDGTLWAMGYNNNGQLGDGTSTSRVTPVQIASSVQKISATGNQSFFIKADGMLWACGLNSSGQLGEGTSGNRNTPAQVATSVASVSAGFLHTLFLKSDGTAWGMGEGRNGQLGANNFELKLLPVPVMTGVAAVAAGNNYSYFLKTDGTLWAGGVNYFGQFGDGTTQQRSTPGQVAADVAAVRTGEGFSLFLRTDGTMWAAGNNYSGQLGDSSYGSRTIPIPVLVSSDTPAIVNVGLPPTITTHPASQNITAGSSFTLGTTATGTMPLFYQWHKDGVPLPSAVGSSYSFYSFSLDRVGAYTVTVTNAYGSATSLAANLALSLPVVTPQIAITGKAVSFAATHGGAGTVSWQISTDGGTTWTTLSNNEIYLGTDSMALRIPNVTREMANHLFRYRITSGVNVATSGPIGINVIASPLALPTALTFEQSSGKLYITDAGAQTVLSIAPDLKLSVVAGKNGETGTANGPATSARFYEPSGLLLSAAGSILLADTSNSSIREINSSGAVSTYAGLNGTAGSVDGNSGTARFHAPVGITTDLSGNLLVTDQSDHTVRLIAGGLVQTVAGRSGIPGLADGQGTAASFNGPSGIAVRRDNNGWINWGTGTNGYGTTFVADQLGHTIRIISTTGLVGTYAGQSGTPGFSNGYRGSARFRQPTGLAFDDIGNLYVADTGNHVIRRIDVYGNVSTYAGIAGVGGLMDGNASQSQFLYPEGVALDNERNVYVADTGNGVIRKITTAGKVSTLLILGNVPTITSQPAGLSQNTGSNASFSVTATGEGTLSYQWKKDGVLIPGATGASYSITTVAAGNAGTYSVAVSNNWGTTESAAATLTVTAPPPASSSGGGSSGASSRGGGGGGAPTLPFLALLGIAAAVRLLRRQSGR